MAVGEITLWAGRGTNVPAGKFICNGASIPCADYPALFNVIGTEYGGDGETTFNLPDLRDVAVAGASAVNEVGSVRGSDTATLTIENVPEHGHSLKVYNNVNDASSAEGNYLGGCALDRSSGQIAGNSYATPGYADGNLHMLHDDTIAKVGGEDVTVTVNGEDVTMHVTRPLSVVQPTIALHYIIQYQ